MHNISKLCKRDILVHEGGYLLYHIGCMGTQNVATYYAALVICYNFGQTFGCFICQSLTVGAIEPFVHFACNTLLLAGIISKSDGSDFRVCKYRGWHDVKTDRVCPLKYVVNCTEPLECGSVGEQSLTVDVADGIDTCYRCLQIVVGDDTSAVLLYAQCLQFVFIKIGFATSCH